MSSNSHTILLIDDESLQRAGIAGMLESHYAVLTVETSSEAISVIHSDHEPEAIILCMNPQGADLLKQLRTTEHAYVPVIIMESNADETADDAELKLGARERLTLPVHGDFLRKRLAEIISGSHELALEQLQHAHDYDELTGIFNRRKFQIRTAEMMADHPEISFVMVHFDIDRFRLYNASLGEEEGDKLICYEADLIRHIASGYEYSTYCRIGGDQFIICHPYHMQQIQRDAVITAELLVKYRSSYYLEPSIGVYQITDLTMPVESMMVRALMASKRSKHIFHKYIGIYDSGMDEAIRNEQFVEREMETALRQEDFKVYFQPKFRAQTDEPYGAEALVRWLHPTRGLIMPGKFIPVFESNGFIIQLDWYMWKASAKYLHEWIAAGYHPDPISVNISRVSLYNSNLVSQLSRLLDYYGIDHSLFELELTESAYMSNPEMMKNRIRELEDAGFSILMDDFGSSYSSLNTLRDIDVDGLKMDMCFLPQEETCKDRKACVIISSVMNMSHSLEIPVTAEGVETRDQRDFLRTTSCSLIQGYYYEKPIPADDYTKKYVARS